MSTEKVDLKKFATGFTQPVEWWKALSIGGKIAIVLLIGFMTYQTFFVKKTDQYIKAEKGSNVSVTQINKTRRFFIPFIEGGVEKNSDVNFETYLRGGLRFEF